MRLEKETQERTRSSTILHNSRATTLNNSHRQTRNTRNSITNTHKPGSNRSSCSSSSSSKRRISSSRMYISTSLRHRRALTVSKTRRTLRSPPTFLSRRARCTAMGCRSTLTDRCKHSPLLRSSNYSSSNTTHSSSKAGCHSPGRRSRLGRRRRVAAATRICCNVGTRLWWPRRPRCSAICSSLYSLGRLRRVSMPTRSRS
jgi:hypothetical protein